MSKVIVAGSINMDVVAQTERHPVPGETIFGHNLHFFAGGKGSNQAVAASRLAEGVVLVGKLGADAFGETMRVFLKGERLVLDYLGTSANAATGTALIVVNAQSENTIVVISGANSEISPNDTAAVPIVPGDVVVSVFEIPQETILQLFTRARRSGARTVLNPAPAVPFIDGLQAQVDYLILNETELAFFAQGSIMETLEDVAAQARALRATPQQGIVVTLGARGVLCVLEDQTVHVAGRAVKAVDTTGAGDCFTGAFAVALSEGMALEAALRFANTAASLSVQTAGAAPSMPQRAAVDASLQG